jgi:hypothetical protein
MSTLDVNEKTDNRNQRIPGPMGVRLAHRQGHAVESNGEGQIAEIGNCRQYPHKPPNTGVLERPRR